MSERPNLTVFVAMIEGDPAAEMLSLITMDGDRIMIRSDGVCNRTLIEPNTKEDGEITGPYRFFLKSEETVFVSIRASDFVASLPSRVCASTRGAASPGNVPKVSDCGTIPKYYDDGGTIPKSYDDPLNCGTIFKSNDDGGTIQKYYDDGGTIPKSYDDPLGCGGSTIQKYFDDGGTIPKSYDDPYQQGQHGGH